MHVYEGLRICLWNGAYTRPTKSDGKPIKWSINYHRSDYSMLKRAEMTSQVDFDFIHVMRTKKQPTSKAKRGFKFDILRKSMLVLEA